MDVYNWIRYQAFLLAFFFHIVSNQRTYKRAGECEYTSKGKCTMTVLLPGMLENEKHLQINALADSSTKYNTNTKDNGKTITSLETEISTLTKQLSELKSIVSDTQHSLQVLQMDTGSVMSDLQGLQSRYGICAKRGIVSRVVRKVSSQWKAETGVNSLHVHSHSAWCPNPNNPVETFTQEQDVTTVEPNLDYEWVQFDLGAANTPVLGVVTRGRADFPQWVTSYKLQYAENLPEGEDQEGWTVYKDVVGLDMIFKGNTDSGTPVTNMLWQPIYARYIRIWPLTKEKNMCMRADIIGCVDS